MAAESKLERRIREFAEDNGMLFLKFTSPGRKGVPDRLLVARKRELAFIELKAPGEVPGAKQQREIDRLRAMGHRVEVIDNFDAGQALVRSLL